MIIPCLFRVQKYSYSDYKFWLFAALTIAKGRIPVMTFILKG